MAGRLPKKSKHQSHNEQNRISSETSSCIFKTYKNNVMAHVRHIYQTESDRYMATIFTYPFTQHVLPHRKRVLCCCENCPFIAIPSH